jgi:hypothetical protein
MREPNFSALRDANYTLVGQRQTPALRRAGDAQADVEV